MALTREWADVSLVDLDLDDRLRLESRALFFIPNALQICSEHKLSVSKMTSRATTARRDRPHLQLAGRQVIGTIFKCKQPVVYDSALRFIALANLDLPPDKWLLTKDIVACAFRIRDPEIIGELGVKPQDLATACGLRREVVDSALKRMRLTYADAHAIWVHLMRVVKGQLDLSPAVAEVLTGDERDFIRTDPNGRYPIAVERAGKIVPRHSKKALPDDTEDVEYVYNRANLRFAPVSHHPWALMPPFAPRKSAWLDDVETSGDAN